MMQQPDHVQCLIVGGGIAGASAAYHLAKMGMTDIVLFERERLTSGSTWHAAGLIMQLRLSHGLTRISRYSIELYSALEAETGQATGLKQNGTLGICRTPERVTETRRVASVAKSFGIEAHIVDAGEAAELYPAIEKKLVEGAIYIPGDGQVNPVDTCLALVRGAKNRGVQICEQMPVTSVRRRADGNYAVETPGGTTVCEKLVLACGLWTRELAAQLGVNVPLYPCEHFYVLTESLDFVRPDMPVLRDTDGHSYVKEDAGKLLVGSFEPMGKAIDWNALPENQAFMELAEDWDHFALPYTKVAELVPALEEVGIQKFFNGPESFTPDLSFIMGEAPGNPNCFVSAGYNSEGIVLGAGAGRALAEWIVEGRPGVDLSFVDIARFHPFQNNRRYLRERAAESVGVHYLMHWPNKQREAGRPARKSPLHDRLRDLGACFGESFGWERPLWYAPKGVEPVDRYSYNWPNWFDHTRAECKNTREAVIFFDQSSFGKHLVQGPDACAFLQHLSAGNVDVEPGRVVYTHFLNPQGGIEADITINRLSEQRFLIVSAARAQTRDKLWMERHLGEQRVTVTDVTGSYVVLSLQGPRSRALLSMLTDADLSAQAFPFLASREIDVGYARVIVNRLTFCGELGFELYVPQEFSQDVFDLLWEQGQSFGLRPAGYHALEHMRLERGFREYGLELTPRDTLLEAGLGFTVDFEKPGGFIGRDVLLAQKERKLLTRRIVQFKLLTPGFWLYRDEPIWRDGKLCGYISSGAYGFTVDAGIGMGYVNHGDGVTKQFIEEGRYEIEIAEARVPAEASLSAFYDPQGVKARS